MRSMTRAAALLMALAVAACAGNPGPPEPAPFDPTGVYDFSTTVEGMTINGSLTVSAGPNGLRGVVRSDATEALTLSSVTVDGRTVTGSGSTPEGTFTITFTVEDDNSFSGGWTLGAMGGSASGVKRPAG